MPQELIVQGIMTENCNFFTLAEYTPKIGKY